MYEPSTYGQNPESRSIGNNCNNGSSVLISTSMEDHHHVVVFAHPPKAADDVEAACARITGGVTRLDGFGVWKDSDGQLVREPMHVGIVSLQDGRQVENLRHAVASILRFHGEECLWFIYFGIQGGLVHLLDRLVATESDRNLNGR